MLALISVADLGTRVATWWATRPVHTRVLLVFATTVFIIELVLRRVAPDSRVYATWTKVFQTIGKFWTAVILSAEFGKRMLSAYALDQAQSDQIDLETWLHRPYRDRIREWFFRLFGRLL